MAPKLGFRWMTTLVVALLLSAATDGANEVEKIADANNVTSKHVIPINPIVIETVLENYDQPTLKEYQECHENAEKCKEVCQGVADVTVCIKQCPICPELIKEQQIMVQGVNDTQLVSQSKPLNTTNIIRLTNEIHNVIDNSNGNITYHNDNTVHLYQNISRVGGKFGLGYNNTDPCCIVMRAKQQCDATKFSTASRCHRKRHRVCGSQCKARVMLAKKVTICDQPDPVQFFEGNEAEENCYETVKYVPYRSQRSIGNGNGNKCGYSPTWPFVQCPQKPAYPSGANCAGCLRMPYGYILRNGIPMQCRSCFATIAGPSFNNPYMFNPYPSYPSMGWQAPIIDSEYFDNSDGGWKEDQIKCMLPDGSISDNCNEFDELGSGRPITEAPPKTNDEYLDYDYLSEVPAAQRRRRQTSTFPRSKYSRRYYD